MVRHPEVKVIIMSLKVKFESKIFSVGILILERSEKIIYIHKKRVWYFFYICYLDTILQHDLDLDKVDLFFVKYC